MKKKIACNARMEVYSRVVGYYRPTQNWNAGKKEEYRQRKTYKMPENKSDEICEQESLDLIPS